MFRFLFLLLIVMSSFVFSQVQENNQQERKAYIFAELEKANNAEVKKQYEEFYGKLKKDFDSQGYIINYGTDKEIAKREKQLRNSMTFRDYDAPRITFVRGGNKDNLKTVFWIVPAGAEPPTP